ncbi:histidine phosphatase family protein [Ancylomarina longa]|uniref:histidine phosphatase family protein n=1 Tax=Ancylomarina longa TaxID=2487017 RepID=UPI001ADE2771|nr:histidine phosphatase family protein [Ancylomarina longa]
MRKLISITLSLFVFCFVFTSFCCAKDYYSLSNTRKSPQNKSDTTYVNEVDSCLQSKLNANGKRMLQIYLIRHAKPNLKKESFYTSSEAQQYIHDYNSVSITPFDPCLVKVNLKANHIIYCSNLRRAQETALAIFGDKYPVVSDTVFREFEIRIIEANSILKLPLGIWQAFSRGSWLLGFNHKGIESYKQAKQRARFAVDNLIKVANVEETAVLLAHGMLNRSIEKELSKRGWKVVQKRGQINLGASILTKIVPLKEQ